MDDLTGELVGRGELKHDSHAMVDVFDDCERVFDGERGVGQLRPGLFVVGLDGGVVLSEAKPKTDECVHVGVGDVVDELADGPAVFAIWSVDLALA